MDEDLRERLRAAAASHRPDRARMLARIERGMAQESPARPARPPRTPMPWLRVSRRDGGGVRGADGRGVRRHIDGRP